MVTVPYMELVTAAAVVYLTYNNPNNREKGVWNYSTCMLGRCCHIVLSVLFCVYSNSHQGVRTCWRQKCEKIGKGG